MNPVCVGRFRDDGFEAGFDVVMGWDGWGKGEAGGECGG